MRYAAALLIFSLLAEFSQAQVQIGLINIGGRRRQAPPPPVQVQPQPQLIQAPYQGPQQADPALIAAANRSAAAHEQIAAILASRLAYPVAPASPIAVPIGVPAPLAVPSPQIQYLQPPTLVQPPAAPPISIQIGNPGLAPVQPAPILTPVPSAPLLTPVPSAPILTPVPSAPGLTPLPSAPGFTPAPGSSMPRPRAQGDESGPLQPQRYAIYRR